MKHILFDLIDCPYDLLNEEEFIQDSLVNAAIVAKSPYLKVETHKFEPQGVTGYALLAESHISIHTWPEIGLAKCDIFCCGETAQPKEAVEYLHRRFKSYDDAMRPYRVPAPHPEMEGVKYGTELLVFSQEEEDDDDDGDIPAYTGENI